MRRVRVCVIDAWLAQDNRGDVVMGNADEDMKVAKQGFSRQGP